MRGERGERGVRGRERAARTSAGMEAWLMKQGSETRDEVEPKETVTLKSLGLGLGLGVGVGVGLGL